MEYLDDYDNYDAPGANPGYIRPTANIAAVNSNQSTAQLNAKGLANQAGAPQNGVDTGNVAPAGSFFSAVGKGLSFLNNMMTPAAPTETTVPYIPPKETSAQYVARQQKMADNPTLGVENVTTGKGAISRAAAQVVDQSGGYFNQGRDQALNDYNRVRGLAPVLDNSGVNDLAQGYLKQNTNDLAQVDQSKRNLGERASYFFDKLLKSDKVLEGDGESMGEYLVNRRINKGARKSAMATQEIQGQLLNKDLTSALDNRSKLQDTLLSSADKKSTADYNSKNEANKYLATNLNNLNEAQVSNNVGTLNYLTKDVLGGVNPNQNIQAANMAENTRSSVEQRQQARLAAANKNGASKTQKNLLIQDPKAVYKREHQALMPWEVQRVTDTNGTRTVARNPLTNDMVDLSSLGEGVKNGLTTYIDSNPDLTPLQKEKFMSVLPKIDQVTGNLYDSIDLQELVAADPIKALDYLANFKLGK